MFDCLQNVWFSVGLKVFSPLMMIGAVMTMAGYSVLAERKVSAWMQGRVGPNRTALPFIDYIPIIGPLLRKLGIFQPLADGLKFLFKEEIVPGMLINSITTSSIGCTGSYLLPRRFFHLVRCIARRYHFYPCLS